MNNHYYLIKIPFSTKGEIRNLNNNLKIKGYANYVYDFESEKIVHEYLELTKANYRITDAKMLVTDYYNKKNSKAEKFRINILDKITNHDSTTIKETIFNNLNENQLQKINSYLKKETTTVKVQFAYLSGSNISGAKTNPKASPLVCTEQRYLGCNFANPMEKLKGRSTLNYQIFKTLSLVDLIKDNNKFLNIFKEYNTWYFNDLLIDISKNQSHWKNEDNDYLKNHEVNYPKDLNEKILNYLDIYFSNNSDWNKSNKNIHKNMLRRFFDSCVKRELHNKKIPFCSTNENFDSSVIENAHIISFAKLVDLDTRESILDAINPFNVLRIDSNTHKLFDRNKITFDLNGNILGKNNEIKREEFLDIKKLPKKTIYFIKENYEYWSIHKINK